jgi:hypothetical protein
MLSRIPQAELFRKRRTQRQRIYPGQHPALRRDDDPSDKRRNSAWTNSTAIRCALLSDENGADAL